MSILGHPTAYNCILLLHTAACYCTVYRLELTRLGNVGVTEFLDSNLGRTFTWISQIDQPTERGARKGCLAALFQSRAEGSSGWPGGLTVQCPPKTRPQARVGLTQAGLAGFLLVAGNSALSLVEAAALRTCCLEEGMVRQEAPRRRSGATEPRSQRAGAGDTEGQSVWAGVGGDRSRPGPALAHFRIVWKKLY